MQGVKTFSQGAKAFGMVNDMQSVIGKPMDTFNLPNPQFKAEGKAIDWKDFNYPPLLRVVHYNPLELPLRARSIAYCLNITYLLVSFACFLNFIDTCIIVSTSSAPSKWIIQSLLHTVLIPGLAFVVFYVGVRGLAEDDTRGRLGQFTLGQILLIIVYVVMSLLPFGCINGLFKLIVVGDYVKQGSAVAFDIAILVESSIWMACAALASVTLARAKNYDRFADTTDKCKGASHV